MLGGVIRVNSPIVLIRTSETERAFLEQRRASLTDSYVHLLEPPWPKFLGTAFQLAGPRQFDKQTGYVNSE